MRGAAKRLEGLGVTISSLSLATLALSGCSGESHSPQRSSQNIVAPKPVCKINTVESDHTKQSRRLALGKAILYAPGKLRSVSYNWGDGTTSDSERPSQIVSHTYGADSKDDIYSVSATATVSKPDNALIRIGCYPDITYEITPRNHGHIKSIINDNLK